MQDKFDLQGNPSDVDKIVARQCGRTMSSFSYRLHKSDVDKSVYDYPAFTQYLLRDSFWIFYICRWYMQKVGSRMMIRVLFYEIFFFLDTCFFFDQISNLHSFWVFSNVWNTLSFDYAYDKKYIWWTLYDLVYCFCHWYTSILIYKNV